MQLAGLVQSSASERLPTGFRWIDNRRDQNLWRQDLDAPMVRYIEQLTIPADDVFGVAREGPGRKLVIVGTFENGFLKASACINSPS